MNVILVANGLMVALRMSILQAGSIAHQTHEFANVECTRSRAADVKARFEVEGGDVLASLQIGGKAAQFA